MRVLPSGDGNSVSGAILWSKPIAKECRFSDLSHEPERRAAAHLAVVFAVAAS